MAEQEAGSTEGRFSGKVALVTGGTRGIGAAISRGLAEQGATVAMGYGKDTARAEEFLDELRSAMPGGTFSTHQGNVASGDDCRRTVQEVIDTHGRLDILVNNAGITRDRTVLKMDDDDWTAVLQVNLSGTFFMAQAALKHMLERGTGRIVNVSSIIGEMGNIGQANYAASKSGLFGLTKTLAREAVFYLQRADKLHDNSIGVTVNTVTPGYVNTEMVEAVPDKVLDKIKGNIPMARLADPDEIARVVGFLCADKSAYITGQVWGVNGGMDM
ncbi:3-oxoacyl-ACP reductase FabG [Naumannella sp. ID2617S]|uniref:3-oxoacyl-ACP reductase n=1 Tax=Enemella dayhoffiae TaxID=2016507 RepID=A0A255H4V9_9ACTN|nr:3-oxoacyl-ACP reductase family protein [Enemella dayhoffiae]NNG19157.1 3-oxoacyl-ACP reductase FabG [Naumannella sp. ID2617S]OYO22695.1 3-oxoacyl-ACP reductase [Enemella dayhoffiae]